MGTTEESNKDAGLLMVATSTKKWKDTAHTIFFRMHGESNMTPPEKKLAKGECIYQI
jgi:hypothetical protein